MGSGISKSSLKPAVPRISPLTAQLKSWDYLSTMIGHWISDAEWEAYPGPGPALPKCRRNRHLAIHAPSSHRSESSTNCQFSTISTHSRFPRQFDLIYTALVFQHVPAQQSIRRYIAEFMRVLKTGGLLVMQLPNHVPLRRRLQAVLGSTGGLGLRVFPNGCCTGSWAFIRSRWFSFLEGDVVSIIESGGGTALQIVADHRAGPHISDRLYYASKTGCWFPGSSPPSSRGPIKTALFITPADIWVPVGDVCAPG